MAMKEFAKAKSVDEKNKFMDKYGFTGLLLAGRDDYKHPVWQRRLYLYTLQDTFSCKKCGKCCRTLWPIRVSAEELKLIASTINMAEDEFSSPIEDKKDSGLTLKQRDGACLFLKDNECSIHLVRPLTCRCFPFVTGATDDFVVGNTTDIPVACEEALTHARNMEKMVKTAERTRGEKSAQTAASPS
jgi:Fe-S-cluster containining protein